VRLSFGAEFNSCLSEKQLDGFLSEFDKLIGEDLTDANKLAYVRLVNKVPAAIARSFPVMDLHVLPPVLT